MKVFWIAYGGLVIATEWFFLIMLYDKLPIFVMLNIICVIFFTLKSIDHRYIKSLFYVVQNRIQIDPYVTVYMEPKSFFLIEKKTGKKSEKYVLEERSLEELTDLAFELEKKKSVYVETYCNVYFFDNNMLATENKKLLVGSSVFSLYLRAYCVRDRKVDRYDFSTRYYGTVVTIKKTRFDQPLSLFFNHLIHSRWELIKDSDFRRIIESFGDTKDLDVLEIYNIYDEYDWCIILKNPISEANQKTDFKTARENPKVVKKCENPKVVKKIEEIDKKIMNGQCFKGLADYQWKDIVRPELQTIATSKKLNAENENAVINILDMISDNIINEDSEDMEISATLSGIQSFLLMNGCSIRLNDEKKKTANQPFLLIFLPTQQKHSQDLEQKYVPESGTQRKNRIKL